MGAVWSDDGTVLNSIIFYEQEQVTVQLRLQRSKTVYAVTEAPVIVG